MSGEEYFHEKFLDPRKQRKIKFLCPRHTVDVDRIYALRSSMIYMDLYMCRFHLLLTGFCQSSPILIFHEQIAGVVQVLLHVFFISLPQQNAGNNVYCSVCAIDSRLCIRMVSVESVAFPIHECATSLSLWPCVVERVMVLDLID